jgi:hypothetical protein
MLALVLVGKGLRDEFELVQHDRLADNVAHFRQDRRHVDLRVDPLDEIGLGAHLVQHRRHRVELTGDVLGFDPAATYRLYIGSRNAAYKYNAVVDFEGGTPGTRRATLRQTPVAVAAGDGGSVLVSDAVLRVPRDAAGGMRAGDLITLPSGQSWRIESRIPGGGPGIDHFVDFTLELA